MIIYDLLALIVLLAVYYLIRNKTQINILWSSIALLLADISASKIAKPLFDLMEKNGWSKDIYVVALIYVVIAIIVWGLIYAILTNFTFNISALTAKVLMGVSAIVFTIALSALACFVANDFGASTSDINICRLCQKVAVFYSPTETKSSFVPSSLKEVYTLPASTQILSEDETGVQTMVSLINSERLKQGREELTESQSLDSLAEMYASLMVRSLRFSHIDANNNNPDQRARSLNLQYQYLGENLAIAPDIQTAHNALMASQNHRANILSENFEKVGVACYLLSNQTYLIVEEFSN